MKIKKIKFKQILKLHLLNSRVYEYSTKKNNLNLLTIAQVLSDLKKALSVIFQYHKAGKQILFIGVPKNLELKINKITNHIAVPKNFNLQGVIVNNNKQLLSKIAPKLLLPKLFKKPDLIVLFSHEKKQNIINESYVAKVPIILFIDHSEIKDSWLSNCYNLQGIGKSLSEISNKNFFFLGLNFLFSSSKKRS